MDLANHSFSPNTKYGVAPGGDHFELTWDTAAPAPPPASPAAPGSSAAGAPAPGSPAAPAGGAPKVRRQQKTLTYYGKAVPLYVFSALP